MRPACAGFGLFAITMELALSACSAERRANYTLEERRFTALVDFLQGGFWLADSGRNASPHDSAQGVAVKGIEATPNLGGASQKGIE